jgi:hypothetical protein
MKYFSSKSFEKLLFPLHREVYQRIEELLNSLERRHPGTLDYLVDLYRRTAIASSVEVVNLGERYRNFGMPIFDILVVIRGKDFSRLRKSKHCDLKIIDHITYGPIQSGALQVHLLLYFFDGKHKHSFIVPLPYVLQAYEIAVNRPDSYQLYRHTLIRKNSSLASTRVEFLRGAAIYIGLTKRSWQIRFREHSYSAHRGSQVRFHKALRGEYFEIDIVEHEVLRIGLTVKEALQLEESHVEKYSLFSEANLNGLNMIPGGEAGLKFLHGMRKNVRGEIDPGQVEFELERYVNEILRQPNEGISGNVNRKVGAGSNEKLVQLWKNCLGFQIAVLTSNEKRLSYIQITCARAWAASGWLSLPPNLVYRR